MVWGEVATVGSKTGVYFLNISKRVFLFHRSCIGTVCAPRARRTFVSGHLSVLTISSISCRFSWTILWSAAVGGLVVRECFSKRDWEDCWEVVLRVLE